MNRQIVVAQATNAQSTASAANVITVTKPQGEQAITIHLDGKTKLDLSAIANEQITLVHLGDRLIILFDNHAQVTIEPFYNDNGQPVADLTVELGPGRDVTAAEFASQFPVSTDPYVLPAAGGPGAPSSGANFASFTIAGLAGPGAPLDLINPESTTLAGPPTNDVLNTHHNVPPTLTGAALTGTADEGGLISFLTFSPAGGNDFGTALPFVVGAPGSLNKLVDFHNEPTAANPFQFVTTTAANAWLASLHLTSHGEAVDHAFIVGNTLFAFTDPAHNVFSLTINANGSFFFQLLDPLDHPAGQGENTLALDLSGLIQAVNAFGQSVTLSHDFTITDIDDVPVLTAATSSGVVDEGALSGPGAPGDLFGSGNEQGNPAFHKVFSGNLEDTVAFGADGMALHTGVLGSEAAGYQFAVANGDTHDFFVQSHGAEVNFVTITDNAPGPDGVSQTLTAWTNGGLANDPTSHEVFTLTLNGDGTYTFTLINPLDNDISDDTSQFTLDLSSLIKGVDFDGDTIALSGDFFISVTNDKPAFIAATPVTVSVDEGALTSGSPPAALGDEFGSGNLGGHVSVTGALSAAVNFGADGPLVAGALNESIRFSIGNGTVDNTLLPFSSHGELIGFFTVDTAADGSSQTLTAFAGGSLDDGGHAVFTLLLNGDGTFTFTLINPIDDLDSLGNPTASTTLDLSAFIALTDFDGDQVKLPPGSLEVVVTDDVPEVNTAATPVTGTVNESGLVDVADGGTDSHGTGTDPTAAFVASGTAGSLLPLVKFGADGPGADGLVAFQFVDQTTASNFIAAQHLTSNGLSVDHATIDPDNGLIAFDSNNNEVFTLRVNSDGSWIFTLLEPLDNGPNQHENGSTIDLSGVVQAIDFDGDTVTLSNDFKVTVVDDTPAPAAGAPGSSATVNEGGLPSGNEPGSATTSGAAAGSLETLVHFGADGANATTPFQFVSDPNSVLSGLRIASHEVLLGFAQVSSTATGFELDAFTGTTAGGTKVFSLLLNEDGSWSVQLFAPIDNNGPRTIDLSGLIEAVDFDGSTATLAANAVALTITDDAPVLTGAAGFLATVNEGGLTHGNEPGSATTSGAAAGSLDALVHFGADGPDHTPFQFVSDPNSVLSGLGLKSHGVDVLAAPIVLSGLGEQLDAFAGSTKVFTLLLNDDGSWSIQLFAPIDHNGPLTIDLSSLVVATDFDGSQTTLAAGSVQVTITDDTPILSTTTSILGSVDEAGLTSPADTHGVGNSPGAVISQTGSGVTSLQNLVLYGADGPGTFGFVDETTAGTFLAGQNLKSHGFLIDHATIDTTTHTLTALDHNNDQVFTLTVNGDGSWTFNLLEPLDDGAGAATINLSGLVQAFDFDGSPVTLANDFQITVNDDTPTLTGSLQGSVDEGGLTATTDPFGTGNDTGAATTTGGSLGIQFGADGAAAVNGVSFADPVNAFNNVSATDANHAPVTLTSHGVALEFALLDAQTLVAYTGATAPTTIGDASVVFSVVLSATAPNGSYDFVLDQPLDQHQAGGDSLNLVFDFTAKDFDGTTVTGSFTVTDTDDAPVLSSFTLSTVVDEGVLESGILTPVVQTVAAPGLNVLVNFGADGAAATAFHVVDQTAATSWLQTLGLKSNGADVTTADVSGSTVTAKDANNNIVFKLTVNGDGSFTFEQDAPIDGVPVNGTHALDISGFINAIDFDGSTKTLAGDVTIEIDNDRPVVADVHASVNEYTPHPPSANTPGTQTSVAITLSETDGTPGAVFFEVTGLPAHGTLFLSDGITQVVVGTPYAATGGTLGLIFQPDAFFAGTINFQYSAFDTNNATSPNPATVTIDVAPVADPPVVTETQQTTLSPADGSTPASTQMVALAGGGFAETWQASGEVFAERFNASGQPIGTPITVGSTSGTAHDFLVALKGGGFAVVWQSGDDLFERTVDASGTVGSTHMIDTGGTANTAVQVVATSDGGFAVLYDRFDGALEGVYTQVFGADGTPAAASEQHVDAAPPNDTGDHLVEPTLGLPAVPTPNQIATLPDGYVVTWSSERDGVQVMFVRVFHNDGTPATSEIQVSAPPAGSHDAGFERTQGGLVTALANGDFAVAWTRVDEASNSSEVITKVFHASDNYAGTAEVVVDPGNGSAQENPEQIIALGTGGYAVMWTQSDGGATDTFVQVYDANGHLANIDPASTGVQVDTATSGAGQTVSEQMLALADGRFAVMWQTSDGGFNDGDMFVRVFNADGTAVSDATQVNQVPTSDPSSPLYFAVQMIKFADGSFAVVYDESVGNAAGNPQDHAFVQHFGADGTAIGDPLELTTAPPPPGGEFSQFDDLQAALSSEGLVMAGGTTDVNGSSFGLNVGSDDTAIGHENAPIALLNASIPPDPSETLKVTITGVPAGASFEINGVTAGAAGPAGTWVIDGTLSPAEAALVAQLATSPLQFVSSVAGTFALTVDVESVDTATLSTSPPPAVDTKDKTVHITVTVADNNDVTLSNPSSITVMAGGGAMALNIAAPVDADNGNDLKIVITALPSYGTVNIAGDPNPVTDGMVLTVAQLTSLTYTPPASGSGHSDSIVYAVEDGPDSVLGSIAVTVTDPAGGLVFSAGDPDLFTVDSHGNLTPIPVDPNNPGHSSAGEDGGFIQFANGLYFFATTTATGEALFRLDANDVSTPVLFNGQPIGTLPQGAHFTIYDGSLYFIGVATAGGSQLFKVDPTGAVSEIVVNPVGDAFGQSNNFGFTEFDGNLYFSAFNASNISVDHTGLYFIDPHGNLNQVVEGTFSLADAGEDGGYFAFNGGLFFNAQILPGLHSLMVLDANGLPSPILGLNSHIHNEQTYFQTLGGNLYLTEDTSNSPDGLLKIDTAGNATEVTFGIAGDSFDFTTAGHNNLGGLAAFNNDLYFSADTSTTDAQVGSLHPVLFQLDGTGAATEVTFGGAPIVNAGEDGGFFAFNGDLYFFGNQGTTTALYELTGGGTLTQVADPNNPAASLAAPSTTAAGQPGPDAHFTVFDGNLYFEATGVGSFTQLYEIDSSGHTSVLGTTQPGEDGGFGTYTPIAAMFGSDGNDHLTGGANTIFIGGKGSDTITGAGSHDTAVIDTNFSAASIHLNGGIVTVTTGTGTDTLSGIDRIQFADKGLLIVDPTGQYGFSSVQAAVNAAQQGDTIWVLPGTYTESTIPTPFSATPGGLFINTPNLTLEGVGADGTPFLSVTDANKGLLPTIISGAQTDFGSNIFIGPNADNTTIEGLHLQAGPQTDNKLLEIWANDATIENNFLDTNIGGTVPSGAIAIYFNDNGTTFTDEIASYTVAGNILTDGIDASNGVGIAGSVSPNQVIAGNTFEGHFDVSTGLGRYDTIVVNGDVPGIGWLLESTQNPLVTGNHFGDNSTPFLLRGSDISQANVPTGNDVEALLANNGDANTTYAYALQGVTNNLEVATRDIGSGTFFSFAVTNTLDTLELALESGGTHTVFPDQRFYVLPGDTVVIQSGPDTASYSVDVNNLFIEANADSAHLTLTMATQLADGEPIPAQAGGAVTQLTLVDYAPGGAANVTVIANNLGDTIETNTGSDTLIGGTGIDTAQYSQLIATSSFSYDSVHNTWLVSKAFGQQDTISGFEKATDGIHNFLLVGGGSQYTTIQAAVNAAHAGDTILVAPGTYTEQVTVNGHGLDGISIVGLGTVTIDAPATLVSTGNSPTNGRDIDGLLTVSNASNVSVENIHFNGLQEGGLVTGANDPTLVGIAYLNASGTVDHVDVTGIREGLAGFGDQRGLAVYVSNTAPAGPPTESFKLTNSTIEDFQKGAVVASNATVDIEHNTITGAGAIDTIAQNGIELVGVTGTASNNTINAIGYIPATVTDTGILFWNSSNLTLDNNTISGALFNGNPVGQTGIYGLNSSNITINGNAIANVLEGIVGQEDGSGNFAGVFAPTWSIGITNTVTNATSFGLDFEATDPFTGALASGNFTVTGTNGDDLFVGGSGTDTFSGAGGNDSFVYNVSSGGREILDGGADTDTLTVNGAVAASTYNINPTDATHLGIDITSGANNAETATTANSEVTTTNVEEIVLNLGNNGDTVLINGDLHGTGVATSTVTINGGTGDDTVDTTGNGGEGGVPVDIVFNGGGGSDTFIFGNGNATFNDTGSGKAVYHETLTTGEFSSSGGHWTVTVPDLGTDTLQGVSTVTDANNNTFLLVGGGSQYTTIQAAVNAAQDGDTIMVAAGTYTENVNLAGKALTIEGLGGQNGVGGAVLDGSFTETGALAGNQTIEGFTINATGQYGIFLSPTLSGPETVTLNNDSVSGASQTGFLVIGGGTDLSVVTTGSSFSGNGFAKTSGGSGDIDFFQFLGNADIENDVITGAALATSLALAGDNAIQIAGFDEATKDVTSPIGDVLLAGVTITGTYAKNLVYVQGYDNANRLEIAEANSFGTSVAPAQTGWTSVFIDLGSQGGVYTPDQTPPSSVDLEGVNLNWSFVGTDPTSGFAALAAAGFQTFVIGTTGADNFTSGPGNDFFAGNGGVDSVHYNNEFLSPTTQFSFNAALDAWIVASQNSGTDALQGISSVSDALSTHHYLFVGAGSEYLTLQDALDVAHDGDDIFVPQGHFQAAVSLAGGGTAEVIGSGGVVETVLPGENLTTGAGNDVFVVGHGSDFTSSDSIDGGTGHNAIYFTSQTNADTLIINPAGAPSSVAANIQEIDLVDPNTFAPDGVAKTVDASTFDTALTFVGNNAHDGFMAGSGDDTFAFTSAQFSGQSDFLNGGLGSDTLLLTDTAAPVTIADADLVNVSSVETIKAVTSGDISLTLAANALNDVLSTGDELTLDLSAAAGKLTLDASGMTDGSGDTATLKVLLGVDGNDVLTGGPGDDIYQFNNLPKAGNDTITNFDNAGGVGHQDQFAVSAAGFGGGLTAGHDASAVFESSGDNQFTSSTDRFHFDTANHGLYYSADGTTAHEVLLATVTNGAAVHGTDIHVV